MDNLFTYTYSEDSIPKLKKLFVELSKVFPCVEKDINTMFNHGVFLHEGVYANNPILDSNNQELLDILPPELTGECVTPKERLEYVRCIISQIMQGKIEKPKWMQYIEEELICGPYGLNPSTFLYLQAKEDKYVNLATTLKEYLYSTKHLTEKVVN